MVRRLALSAFLASAPVGVLLTAFASAALGADEGAHAVAQVPDSIPAGTLHWLLGIGTAIGTTIMGIVGALWNELRVRDKAHAKEMKVTLDTYSTERDNMRAASASELAACTAAYTAEKIALRDQHATELATASDRLDREQVERREDVERLHTEHKEVMKTSMTVMASVQGALDRNTQQIARVLDQESR
jgi:hypothetical protein